MNEKDDSLDHGGGGGIGLCMFVIGTGIVIGWRVIVCVFSFRVWPIEINVLHVMFAVVYSFSPPSCFLAAAAVVVVVVVVVVFRDATGVRFEIFVPIQRRRRECSR